MTMVCADCGRELEIGDQYIEGTAGDYLKQEVDPEIAGLIADILGGSGQLDGSAGGKIVYCEDCTRPGGDFRLNTYYGDAGVSSPDSPGACRPRPSP